MAHCLAWDRDRRDFALFVGVAVLVFMAAKWLSDKIRGEGQKLPPRLGESIVVAAFIVFYGYIPALIGGLMAVDHVWWFE